jgi:hypothetical protein
MKGSAVVAIGVDRRGVGRDDARQHLLAQSREARKHAVSVHYLILAAQSLQDSGVPKRSEA